MNTIWILIQFILAFALIVSLHEFGHFLMAKFFKVEVEEFGIGLPPRAAKLFTWGGTDFTLNWLPFGAFVKPKNEFGDDISEGGFKAAKPWQQFLIYLAGPIMNLLTAFVLYSVIILNIGSPDPSRVIIDQVESGSPAEIAGILPGDQIVRIAGQDINSFEVVTETVDQYLDQEIPIRVLRNGEYIDLKVTPLSNPPEGRGAMGIVITYPMVDYPFFEGIVTAARDTGNMIHQYVQGIWQLITGKIDMGIESIVGPVGMFSYYEEAATLDEQAVLENEQKTNESTTQTQSGRTTSSGMNRLAFFVVVSIALGITNLFPIPALDGGQILLLMPQLLFKKKLSPKVEYYFNAIGMACLLLLMAVIMFKDIFMLANG
ncbi:MAG TPA: M50 family metallopeptidase [Flexilinea sp.]|nr:M50 family metallopeptidase [Flexilinea sp.]